MQPRWNHARSAARPKAPSHAGGLEGKELSSLSGRERKMAFTSPVIDQAYGNRAFYSLFASSMSDIEICRQLAKHQFPSSLRACAGRRLPDVSSRSAAVLVNSKITITRPPIRVLETKSHGWHDLAVFVAGGGIQPGYEADVPFNGERYATNPSSPPAHRLSPQSAGRVVIPDSPAF